MVSNGLFGGSGAGTVNVMEAGTGNDQMEGGFNADNTFVINNIVQNVHDTLLPSDPGGGISITLGEEGTNSRNSLQIRGGKRIDPSAPPDPTDPGVPSAFSETYTMTYATSGQIVTTGLDRTRTSFVSQTINIIGLSGGKLDSILDFEPVSEFLYDAHWYGGNISLTSAGLGLTDANNNSNPVGGADALAISLSDDLSVTTYTQYIFSSKSDVDLQGGGNITIDDGTEATFFPPNKFHALPDFSSQPIVVSPNGLVDLEVENGGAVAVQSVTVLTTQAGTTTSIFQNSVAVVNVFLGSGATSREFKGR